MNKFSDRINELREEKGLSQAELAKKIGTISQSAIAKWELGKTQPRADAIIELCRFFQVSADYLLGLED